MKTLLAKKILKLILFVGGVLAVGQIEIKDAVVGKHFVTGVRNAGLSMASKLAQSKMFASLSHPSFLEKGFPFGEKYSRFLKGPVLPGPKRAEATSESEPLYKDRKLKIELEPMTASDQAAALPILE